MAMEHKPVTARRLNRKVGCTRILGVLIMASRAFQQLGLPREGNLCYTRPGFATSERTKTNAHALMQAFGVRAEEIDITTASRQTLVDIGHPNAHGLPVYDTTFENVQAGARTALLVSDCKLSRRYWAQRFYPFYRILVAPP
jgi:NH3-dependent NAD+ synthetase